MEEIELTFEINKDVDPKQVLQKITERLSNADRVEEFDASIERPRLVTGLEVPTIITATVMITSLVRVELVELRRIVAEFKGLLGDLGITKMTARAGKETVMAAPGRRRRR